MRSCLCSSRGTTSSSSIRSSSIRSSSTSSAPRLQAGAAPSTWRCRAAAAQQQQQQQDVICLRLLQRVSAASLAAVVAISSCVGAPSAAAAAAAVYAAPAEHAAQHAAHAAAPAAAEHAAQHAAQAPAGTAAAEFRCTPLSPTERASFLDLRDAATQLPFSHPINTKSKEAQALFDQGLLLAFNFNRPEAARSFQAGLAFDPDAAMLHWGVAHSQGPYANKVWGRAPADGSFPVMAPEELAVARDAARAGLAAARAALAAAPGDDLARAEAALLASEERLWGGVAGSDDPRFYRALEVHAQELEAIGAAFPAELDAHALAAEARMNLSPWEHWRGPLGKRLPVKPRTVVTPALADITEAFARRPGHPLAAHLMIHLTEAGTPGPDAPAAPGYAALGEAAADLLATGPAYPDFGHLVHMPSHTYLRLGRWHAAVESNIAALAADERVAKRCIEPYMPEHNSQLLLYAAMNSGELRVAQEYADRAVDFPRTFGPTNMPDGRERASKALIQARFGLFEPLLQLQPDDLDYSRDGLAMLPPGAEAFGSGVRHYVRLLALASAASHEPDAAAAQHLVADARQELRGLEDAVAATPRDPLTRPGPGIGIYSPGFQRLGRIELLAARARLDVLQGRLARAAAGLRAAVALEAGMGYTEPPRQYQPMNECLGWVLLQAERLPEAERAYLEDLAEYPENAWALKGLQQVYARQAGGTAASKLQQVDARLAAAWAHADAGLTLSSSCPSFSD